MKLKKMIVTTCSVALALVCLSLPVSAANWKMATKMPADSAEGKIFSYFASQVAKETNGKITVTVFPNEQLGKEDAVLEQLQAGIVQIYAEGFPFMRKWTPELQWVEPPFLFENYDHWVNFMQSDLVKGWFADAAKKSGIMPLGDPTAILRGPYRVMVSNKPVSSVADLSTLKLRVPNAKLSSDVWTEIGAHVITLPWTDVYSSISKNIVNAVNSPIALVEAMRFNEVASYIIRHDEFWQSIGFMMNQKAFEGLDAETKAQVLKAYNAAGAYSKELMYKTAEESIARMKAKGATFSTLDTAALVSKARPYYDRLKAEGKLPEGLLETVTASRPH